MRLLALLAVTGSMTLFGACSSETKNEGTGAASSGGASTGGTSTGGASTGGAAGIGAAGAGGAATGGAAGSDAGSDAGMTCPGSEMVAIGPAFCMDKTEVTTGSYAKFLEALKAADAGPTNVTALSACNGIVDYAPASDVDCPVAPYTSDLGLPMRCVDWCSAYAYCKWAGKRLCGAIPADSLDPTQASAKNAAQWYTACIGDGPKDDTYFYGESFDEFRCQTAKSGTIGAVTVATKPECQSIYYKGLVDMTGNVAEWEDSCDSKTTPGATCNARGGSYLDDTAPALSCASVKKLTRTQRQPDVGFRCCWDASVGK